MMDTKQKKIEIDEKKLRIMMMKIINLEKQNMKTRKHSQVAMVEEIRKIIIDESNKKI